MKNPTSILCLTLLGTLVCFTGPLIASDNSFLDDFWRSDGPAPAPPNAAPAERQTPPTNTRPAARTAPVATTDDLVPAVQGLPPDPGDVGRHRITPGDILKISVFQVDELSSEERVNEAGEIVMPLIGPVHVGGLTPMDAETQIARILGKDYLQDPQVNIYVTQSSTQQVTVMGSVQKPGVFPISGRTTLLQAIALAEGTTKVANEDEVIVFRPDVSGRVTAYVVDLAAIKQGILADPLLSGEDRVVVPKSGTRVFIGEITDALRGFVRPFVFY